GIPSQAVTKAIANRLTDANTALVDRIGMVELLGESLVAAGVPTLIQVADEGEARDESSIKACEYLMRWAHQPAVRDVLERVLIRKGGARAAEALRSLQDVVDGCKALDRIVRKAEDDEVRTAAVRALAISADRQGSADFLWNIVRDETLTEWIRAEALRGVRATSLARRPEAESLLAHWSAGIGPLAEAAQSLTGEPEAMELQEQREALQMRQWLRGRELLERQRAMILGNQQPLNVEAKTRLAQIETRLAEICNAIQRLEPEARLRLQVRPPQDIRRIVEQHEVLRRARDDYSRQADQLDSSQKARLEAIEQRLQTIERQLERADPSGSLRDRLPKGDEDAGVPKRAPLPE
ncbi:MAG: hypothetical protein U1E05_07955, partial [Patescibacteria group bacterium]|nr:hypothetical protein [Patescibacteria group bacterium]